MHAHEAYKKMKELNLIAATLSRTFAQTSTTLTTNHITDQLQLFVEQRLEGKGSIGYVFCWGKEEWNDPGQPFNLLHIIQVLQKIGFRLATVSTEDQ